LENVNEFDAKFPIVYASQLSLRDKFMQHEPKTDNQKKVFASLVESINYGISDFRKPAMDPSRDEDGNIVFEFGNQPVDNYSAKEWKKIAENFMVEKNSRIGFEKNYYAFMGTLIKYFVDEQGKDVEEAWRMVCDDSRELGHYRNSEDAKEDFEPTGSRKVSVFYDLVNTYKIIRKNNGKGFLNAGGYYCADSTVHPLASMHPVRCPSLYCTCSVGWMIMDV